MTAQNSESKTITSGFSIWVDNEELTEQEFAISPGDVERWSFNTSRGFDVTKDEHTVDFSTFGNSTSYNITRDIETADAEAYPTPYIGNVTVTEGTVDGETSSVAKVEIVNPGPQTYGMKLLVNTEGTDGSFYAVGIPSYSSETFTVELLEPVGDKIAGEGRLYTERPRDTEGALDQVEFVGSPDSKTKQWNTSYEPARGPWLDNSYEYENESIDTDMDNRENANPFDDPDRRKEVNAIALTLVALFGVLAYRKLNRSS
ncbi:hypothetical protein ACFO0N_00525 [Halobium salinum]|uniref:DUF3344 domain-containing protein n=1 Tax=Halobium salinum TaxID=1364940 RepID=A0ABD5P6E5_9EURY|nr:hypothetical protein [Halobium salinum]